MALRDGWREDSAPSDDATNVEAASDDTVWSCADELDQLLEGSDDTD